MELYDIRFLKDALDDLEEDVLYIAKDSKQAALLMHDKIIQKSNDLAHFPKLGRFVPDKKITEIGFRMLIVDKYIIFYRIIQNIVYIHRVLHGARNFPNLLAR